MNEQKQPSSLDDLDTRLNAARKKADAAAGRNRKQAVASTGIGFAMRIGVELVASLLVGGGIGLLLDRWLGTEPWLMLVFFLLGAAAGFINVYRVMNNLGQIVGYPAPAHEDRQENKPDKLKRD